MAKENNIGAVLTDVQFWIPAIALAFGIVLLALLSKIADICFDPRNVEEADPQLL